MHKIDGLLLICLLFVIYYYRQFYFFYAINMSRLSDHINQHLVDFIIDQQYLI